MLSGCNVLAKESLRSFLSGKHYNRCKRLHEILSLSMEVLHVKFFMNSLSDDQIAICKNIKEWNQCNEKEKQDVDAVINLYNLFTEQSETTRCTWQDCKILDQLCWHDACLSWFRFVSDMHPRVNQLFFLFWITKSMLNRWSATIIIYSSFEALTRMCSMNSRMDFFPFPMLKNHFQGHQLI